MRYRCVFSWWLTSRGRWLQDSPGWGWRRRGTYMHVHSVGAKSGARERCAGGEPGRHGVVVSCLGMVCQASYLRGAVNATRLE